MQKIVALETKKERGNIYIADSEGNTELSNNPADILSFMVAPYENTLKVCWDMQTFLEPVTRKLPADVIKHLNNGERAHYENFKLFRGVGKGEVFGVDWKVRENLHGNFYSEDNYESNIYQLKTFYPNEPKPDINELKRKAEFLLTTLQGMGITPTKLTSPAAIYEESVLAKLNIPTIFEMPEYALEMAEWCANYIREWRTCYQIGMWDTGKVFEYDKSAAYPSTLAKVPDLHNVKYVKTDGTIPKGCLWGIMRGMVDITADVSPIVSEDGKCYKGTYEDYLSTTDWSCMARWDIGSFTPVKGWFLVLPEVRTYPFAKPMTDLYAMRDSPNELQTRLAKAMAVGAWGKLAARYNDRFGDLYYPIIPSMITSRVRIDDCNFIYENDLPDSLVTVQVDGVKTTKSLDVTADKHFGGWRKIPCSPALVLSSTFQWYADKKPANVDVNEMANSIRQHPMSKSWHGVALRFLEEDRQFDHMPKNGNDLINNIYHSTALVKMIERRE